MSLPWCGSRSHSSRPCIRSSPSRTMTRDTFTAVRLPGSAAWLLAADLCASDGGWQPQDSVLEGLVKRDSTWHVNLRLPDSRCHIARVAGSETGTHAWIETGNIQRSPESNSDWVSLLFLVRKGLFVPCTPQSPSHITTLIQQLISFESHVFSFDLCTTTTRPTTEHDHKSPECR